MPLLVTGSGSGSGSVVSAPPGVLCATNCAEYVAGTVVTLTFTATDSTFDGWSGACNTAGVYVR